MSKYIVLIQRLQNCGEPQWLGEVTAFSMIDALAIAYASFVCDTSTSKLLVVKA